jgi:hypothetical protein
MIRPCHFCHRKGYERHASWCPHGQGVETFDLEHAKATARRLLAQCGLTRERMLELFPPVPDNGRVRRALLDEYYGPSTSEPVR